MKILRAAVLHWLPTAVALVAVCGLIYVTGQQLYRRSADDPQIQMAGDAARELENGTPDEIIPAEKVEISQSLAPYLIVFDVNGNPVASNARLHGQIPAFVTGALRAARQKGENRITWQPEAGVRSAVVIVPVAGGEKGFVLAGRSLREAESRIQDLTYLTGAGLAGSLAASLIAAIVADLLKR